jgi:hypothetical protein
MLIKLATAATAACRCLSRDFAGLGCATQQPAADRGPDS